MTTKNIKIGVLALARSTFDIEYATQKHLEMLAQLKKTEKMTEIIGGRELLLDDEQTATAIDELEKEPISALLILQVTFTDSRTILNAVDRLGVPLMIWATPEPRNGGRLRLNSFCGLNLAAHALGMSTINFNWLYQDPMSAAGQQLQQLMSRQTMSGANGKTDENAEEVPAEKKDAKTEGARILDDLRGRRIACIGQHPDGFSTCAYEPAQLNSAFGIEVDNIELDRLFDIAKKIAPKPVESLESQLSAELDHLDQVDRPQLKRSLALKFALDDIGQRGNYDAFAIRCWPETFTEYGGAVCGPAGMLGEKLKPCACEADVYGAVTQLLMQKIANAPVFLTDIVDLDREDDTGVLWHCGQAPASMADTRSTPAATIHTNRKMPLLYEFALKPGQVTLARISRSCGMTRLVISTGKMLQRPRAYTGTSGVIRFDEGTSQFLDRLIEERIEHHLCLAYGDHATTLTQFAEAAKIPIVRL